MMITVKKSVVYELRKTAIQNARSVISNQRKANQNLTNFDELHISAISLQTAVLQGITLKSI
ncbi:hypothetical protein MHM87_12305 [Alteromonas sp. Cnat3-28]|jgi:hypothetical protein|uniref:hypothetical protein n=1 Tax=unclassified Alteromonas TaxID=2614992 RepID=UPI000948BF11|nr:MULTISPECIES: hypothetical protein [unclassified Alteromonas]MCG7646361.1 hypothetical protein [Alteromonas sp. Cnat3-28]MDP6879646.1 hypothetical protein [Alteromonas macleodii]OLF72592.1 hypothetical protein AWH61_17235 [Alteromonas sp. W12]|tara:strand:+ start:1449 stop:1634 length:186 start_codon:yes stop_codon:yes gene_type:complete